ncbi:hypothetical protein YL93_21705 [Salmonella enterica subsp. enterica serovar Montevideo]|nr:hypothetical protein [Salmonella enterica subsp. enterica serovar Montevideo]
MTGLILSLVLLIYLIYCGVPVLIVSPLMVMLAVLMGSEIPVLYSWTGSFMQSVVGFVAACFPIVGLAMQASGKELMALSVEHHIPAGVMQRVIVFSTSTFDTLSHSGFIITLLCVCGLTHKQNLYLPRICGYFHDRLRHILFNLKGYNHAICKTNYCTTSS